MKIKIEYILFLCLVILVDLSCASVILSCFTFPIVDLSSYNIEISIIPANSTYTVDICVFGIASIVWLEIIPSIFSSQLNNALKRISSEPASLTKSEPYLTNPNKNVLSEHPFDVPEYDKGYRRSDWYGNVPEDMDTAENRIVTNMQIESEFGDADQNIKPKVKKSKSEPLAVGNEWSEQVVDNDYDWSEPEIPVIPFQPKEQDYNDIDYTSGGVVHFQASHVMQ